MGCKSSLPKDGTCTANAVEPEIPLTKWDKVRRRKCPCGNTLCARALYYKRSFDCPCHEDYLRHAEAGMKKNIEISGAFIGRILESISAQEFEQELKKLGTERMKAIYDFCFCYSEPCHFSRDSDSPSRDFPGGYQCLMCRKDHMDEWDRYRHFSHCIRRPASRKQFGILVAKKAETYELRYIYKLIQNSREAPAGASPVFENVQTTKDDKQVRFTGLVEKRVVDEDGIEKNKLVINENDATNGNVIIEAEIHARGDPVYHLKSLVEFRNKIAKECSGRKLTKSLDHNERRIEEYYRSMTRKEKSYLFKSKQYVPHKRRERIKSSCYERFHQGLRKTHLDFSRWDHEKQPPSESSSQSQESASGAVQEVAGHGNDI